MKMQRSAMRAFVVKEFHHILRDRQTLTVLLMMPLVQVLLFGYAMRTDVRDIRVAVVDPAPDATTSKLVSRFAGTQRFHIVEVTPSAARVDPLMRSDQADMALVLGSDFSERLARGEPGPVLVITDASDPNTGSTMQAYALSVLNDFTRDLPGAARGVQIPLVTRMRFNPTLESVNLFVPGLMALVLTLVSAMMTAVSLSREKERGTMEILLVSPLRPTQIIVGKVLPYMTLGFANALTALGAAELVFHVPLRGSVVLLLVEALIFTLASLALGVLIAVRTSSQRAAMLGAMIGTMLPNVLLSGMVFPIASMPEPLRALSYIIPARWFLIIVRGIMLKGIGLAYLWPQTLVLAGMTVVLLAIATRSFRPRLA